MCGIVGIVGKTNISEQLFRCIKNLEYRGYDSCGVAILHDDKVIEVRKNIGSVDEVNTIEHLAEPQGIMGLAHTRWATHGGVTKPNSHPHVDCHQTFVVVHNGIISNYRELREELKAAGHEFRTETDTETIPHVLEDIYQQEQDVEQTLLKALDRLEGTYALAFMTQHDPDRLYCARKESPLVLGVGEDRMFLASDINSFIEYTKDIVILQDHEYAIISQKSYEVKDIASGARIAREIERVEWDHEAAQKGGFENFMLKEIFEQPETVQTVLNIDQHKIEALAHMIHEQKQTYLVGVGTTYYVSLIGQYYFAKLAQTFIPAISSDEFEYTAQVDQETVFICSSQSGETYDTLKALRFAKKQGVKSAAIVNVVGSSISREVDLPIMQGSGPEICVLSTKAAFAQIIVLLRTALELGKLKGTLSEEAYQQYQKELQMLPKAIRRVLDRCVVPIHAIAKDVHTMKNWLFLGRGIYMATVMEAALKMKEVTYHHVEGMPGGFMKHGTISLIDKNIYTLFLIPPEEEKELYEATMSNVEEVKARGGFLVGFHFGSSDVKFDKEIIFPDAPLLIAPLLELIGGQLFAYFTAVELDRNIDKPRSLAKSVTVA